MAVAPTLLGGQYKERRQPRASAAGRTPSSLYWTQAEVCIFHLLGFFQGFLRLHPHSAAFPPD
jgi:hypothetical protein